MANKISSLLSHLIPPRDPCCPAVAQATEDIQAGLQACKRTRQVASSAQAGDWAARSAMQAQEIGEELSSLRKLFSLGMSEQDALKLARQARLLRTQAEGAERRASMSGAQGSMDEVRESRAMQVEEAAWQGRFSREVERLAFERAQLEAAKKT